MQSVSINAQPPADPGVAPDFVVSTTTGVAVDPSKLPDPAQQQEQRPEWLPEKFKSAQDLAKAYAELESKLGKPAEKPTETTTETPTQQQQFDLDAVSAEFAQNGKLSEESYQKLEQSGIKRTTVDTYIRGQAALQAQTRTEIASAVGGEQALQDILTWAKTGISKSEAAAYDAVVEAGDVAQIKIALAGLQARYTAAVGTVPGLVRGDTPPTGSVHPYESTGEVVAAMSNPLYNTSPSYRKQVEARMAVTTLFG